MILLACFRTCCLQQLDPEKRQRFDCDRTKLVQNRLLSNVCRGPCFVASRNRNVGFCSYCYPQQLGRYRGYILEGYPTTFAEAEVRPSVHFRVKPCICNRKCHLCLDVFFQQSSQALFMERVREEGEEIEEEEARD